MDELTKNIVLELFDQGKTPSDLKGRGLKAKTLKTYFDVWKKDKGIVDDIGKGGPASATPPAPSKVGDVATKLQLRPQTFVVNYTPTMHMAFNAAVNEWGIPEDTRFDDFLDAILDHFFLDRGIKLGGYIVMTEQEEEKNGREASVSEVGG